LKAFAVKLVRVNCRWFNGGWLVQFIFRKLPVSLWYVASKLWSSSLRNPRQKPINAWNPQGDFRLCPGHEQQNLHAAANRKKRLGGETKKDAMGVFFDSVEQIQTSGAPFF